VNDDYQPDGERVVQREGGGNWLLEFLLFRRMVTPVFVQAIFWLGVIASIVVGGLFVISSLQAGQSAVFGVLYGALILVGGPIALRIACELLLVLFRIHEALNEIRERARDSREK
jgi:hypothetical protein